MATAAQETFSPLIRNVAVALLGEPSKGGPQDDELRWGSRGSFKVDVPEGTWYDNESKKGGGVLDLVMRERRCDKSGALHWLEGEGLIEAREAPAKAFYNYHNETGVVLFKVERLGKGHIPPFLQHGPDGRGGFVCRKGCMTGVRRVLYHLDKLARTPLDRLLFVTEGEKDCDRLLSAGLAATTNPGGAGKFAGLEDCIAQHMTGRRVVILQDNDEAGAGHVAAGIKAIGPHAAAVAGLLLPGLREKGDVSDWLNAGGTAEALVQMAEAALGVVPQDAAKPKGLAAAKGITASALMAKRFDPIRYVIPGYVAEGLTLFAGAPKIGKSWGVLDMGIGVAVGGQVFGAIQCEQGDVLYLALEDNERRLQSRLRAMGRVMAPQRLTFMTEWPALDDGCVDELEAWAHSVDKPRLVIVDVLAKVRPPANGRDQLYDADYRTMTGLHAFATRHRLAVVVVHHTRKMEAEDPFDQVSGTRGLTGAADTVMVLKRDIGTAKTVLYVRGRDIEEVETALEFKRDIGTWVVLGAAHEVGKTNERQAILYALKGQQNPLSAREISDLLGKNHEAVRKCLTRMAHAGEIEKTGRGMYACPNGPNVPFATTNTPQTDIGTHGTGGKLKTIFPDNDPDAPDDDGNGNSIGWTT